MINEDCNSNTLAATEGNEFKLSSCHPFLIHLHSCKLMGQTDKEIKKPEELAHYEWAIFLSQRAHNTEPAC